MTLFLLLRAFSSGASALTGVEAVADGVQAFRRPQAKNAATTLAIMGALASVLFLGITVMSDLLQVRVTEEVAHSRSVLSLIGDAVFGGGFWFILLQVFTAGILVLAANTAFQDFPGSRRSSLATGSCRASSATGATASCSRTACSCSPASRRS